MKTRTQLLAVFAATLVPGLASAQIQWNSSNGNLGTATNWTPNTPITATGNSWSIENGGTATVDNGNTYTLTLGGGGSPGFYVGNAGGSGTLILNGNGSLTVTGGNMSIGQNANGGSGSVTLNGTSRLTTGAIFIGHRRTGSLTVNSGATVNSTTVNIATGSNGGNGTVNLYGTLHASGTSDISIRLGNSTQNTQGTLNIFSGASLTSAGGLTTNNQNGPFAINVNGSGSTISLAGNVVANNAVTTFSFLADEGGVSTVFSSLNVNIGGSFLRLNIDDYVGTGNLVLFSGLTGVTGTFANVTWLGSKKDYQIVYGANSIYVVVPEPTTLGFLGLGVLALAMTNRRRRKEA